MPAPLGNVPTRKMPNIEVLGVDDSAATRNAIRFFRERRIVARYRDLRHAPLRPDEIRWFLERLGTAALVADVLTAEAVEPGATDAGAASPGAAADVGVVPPGIVGRILADPGLLRVPLVRFGTRASAGRADDTWKGWLARPK